MCKLLTRRNEDVSGKSEALVENKANNFNFSPCHQMRNVISATQPNISLCTRETREFDIMEELE